MFIGWGVLLQAGAFIARYFRHKDPWWFKMHRGLQVNYKKQKILARQDLENVWGKGNALSPKLTHDRIFLDLSCSHDPLPSWSSFRAQYRSSVQIWYKGVVFLWFWIQSDLKITQIYPYIFQVTGLVLTIAGLICAFISVPFDHLKFAHGALGIIIMIIGVGQPLNAAV